MTTENRGFRTFRSPSPWALPLLLAGLGATASVRADFPITYTATNYRSDPQGELQLHAPMTFSAAEITVNAPFCPPAQTRFVSTPPNLTYLIVDWPCACVRPGDSVTLLVHADSETELTGEYWYRATVCPGVLPTSFQITDLDGDLDGYPDTGETFDLNVALANQWQDLTNVVAHLTTEDPKLDCVLASAVAVGSFPAGATLELPSPFRLHVHPAADRAGTVPPVACAGGACSNGAGTCATAAECTRSQSADYSAAVTITLVSDQVPGGERLPALVLDLDLNVASPVTATSTYTEGAETGLGTFLLQSLDENLQTNTLSDGMRCQSNDPDFPNSQSYGATECYLGFTEGQPQANDWHIHTAAAPDGGRAFSGSSSFHYGLHTAGSPELDTYGFSQMDAIRTKNPLNLAARVCLNDPAPSARACNTASDCVVVGGGPCVSARPELSFKHQISTSDERFAAEPGEALDRAVVQAQISAAGAVWRKIAPYQNVYDVQAPRLFTNCKFDPVDDGNNEDSFFDPSDPARVYGPSSTCWPEFAFSLLGDTDESYAPNHLGRANVGPGLEGSVGIGTWVESKIDLSRFRGRAIRLRWLFTSLKVSDRRDWGTYFANSPAFHALDDGWYLDDVRVSETLGTSSPSVALDTRDNAALAGNADGDARGDLCDCAPLDPTAFAPPGEIGPLAPPTDKDTIQWTSVTPLTGSGTVYDVARGALDQLPVGSGGAELCVAAGITAASTTDTQVPDAGKGYWYLVRARNGCGVGTYGYRSGSVERSSAACP